MTKEELMNNLKKDGFHLLREGWISTRDVSLVDCNEEQSFNPILSKTGYGEEVQAIFSRVGAEIDLNLDNWKCEQNWQTSSFCEFILATEVTVPEHKELWDGESPLPEFTKEGVAMPVFNTFDKGDSDGLITIAEHKGEVWIIGSLTNTDVSMYIWLKK